jgi:hypothetical protein
MVMRTTTSVLLGVITTAAAAAAVLALSSVAAPAESSARGTRERAAVAAMTYSIFASPTARFNAAASGWSPPPAEAGVGARLQEARLILQDKTRTVAAVPASKAPCLFTRFADGSQTIGCGHTADEQPTSVSYSGAIGLVPDAVDSVTLTMTDGSTRVVRVENNVWKAPDDAAKAAYSVAGSVVQVELMPRSSIPAGATTDPSQAPSRGPDSAG